MTTEQKLPLTEGEPGSLVADAFAEPPAPLVCPEPGIYFDIPDDVYRGWSAMNYSRLKWIEESLEDYAENMKYPPRAGDEQVFGSAVDLLLHEPGKFDERFVVGGPVNPKTGKMYGRETHTFAEWRAEQPDGKEFLSEPDYQRAQNSAEAVRQDEAAMAMLSAGRPQVCVVWHDAETNELLKARLDWLGEAITDLKTAHNAEAFPFASAMSRWGYHIQAALYTDGHERVAKERKPWRWIVVQSVRPHKVRVYEPGDMTLVVGRKQYRRALHALRGARTRGVWKEYSVIRGLDLPRWLLIEELGFEAVRDALNT